MVGEAADGRDGVDGIAETQPDVVVLDIAMPHLSGLEAVRDIRDVAPNAGIVVFTGLPGAEASAERLGVDDFLRKSDSLDYVILAIKRVGLTRRAQATGGD